MLTFASNKKSYYEYTFNKQHCKKGKRTWHLPYGVWAGIKNCPADFYVLIFFCIFIYTPILVLFDYYLTCPNINCTLLFNLQQL